LFIIYDIASKKKNQNKKQEYIIYSLHLYIHTFQWTFFFKNTTAKAISRFVKRRSHNVALRVDWILKYTPKRLLFRKLKISKFIIGETQLKVGSSELIWLCG